METELSFLTQMTKAERKELLQQQAVISEQQHLIDLIDENKQDDKTIQWCIVMAEQHHEDGNIAIAAEYVRLAKMLRSGRHTIAEIRTQREKVQWERNQLKTKSSLNDEPSKS